MLPCRCGKQKKAAAHRAMIREERKDDEKDS
jgi:hypothetical protein